LRIYPLGSGEQPRSWNGNITLLYFIFKSPLSPTTLLHSRVTIANNNTWYISNRREDFEYPHNKQMLNIKAKGSTNYPELIFIQHVNVLKYYIIPHKCVQLLCVNKIFLKWPGGGGCSTVVCCLPRMCEALGSILSTTKQKQNPLETESNWNNLGHR
jgi:hypothetical protein